MRLEPFVFLGIILLVWFLSAIGSWLRQAADRQSPSFPEADPPADAVEDPPSPNGGSVTPEEATQDVQEETMAVLRTVSMERRSPPTSGRLRYRSSKAVREGIVMMTVFGSCKALDVRKDPWLRDG